MIMRKRRSWTMVFLSIVFFFHCGPSWGLTVNEENEISREFMSYIYTNYELVSDPEIAQYIQKIGDRILASFPPQPFTYRFYVIKNDTYNAFAGPGAQIFIHTGLFEALDNEDELAGIIGHEISHSACRHIAKNIDRSGKIGLGTLAGVAAGIFMSIYGDPAAGSAMMLGTVAGSQSVALAYSRDDELQADQIGLTNLASAGYSASGLIDALNIIRSKQWYGKEQIPTYLTTHPALEDRISFIKNWMERYPEKQRPKNPDDTFEFNMIHTKVVALYGDVNASRARFETILKKEPDNIFGLYGMGMVLARSGKMDESIIFLKKALEKRALHVGMLKTLGKVYFNNGMYTNAQNVFEGALTLVPRDYECNLYLARILTESGKFDQALELLIPFASEEHGEILAYYYLGDIYARKGMMIDSYYQLGLYYWTKKDVKNALTQFERALKLTENPDIKNKIQDRIDDVKGQEKKEKKQDDQKKPSFNLFYDHGLS